MIGYYQVGNKRVIRLADGNLLYPNEEQTEKIDFKKGGIKLLGGQKEYLIYLEWLMVQYMKRMYTQSERTSYLMKNKSNQKGGAMSLYGRNGLFGEVNGTCGWGNSPSCCFSECAPIWRTEVWPLGFSM